MRKVKELLITKIFSDNLKRKMFEQNISPIKMSRDLNLNKSSISQWMNGKNFPSPETVKIISECLGTSIYELYGKNSDGKVKEYSTPASIDTINQAIEFLNSLNLFLFVDLDIRQKSNTELITLARTILSVLIIQGRS